MAEGRRVVLAGEILHVVVERADQAGELGEKGDLAQRAQFAERGQLGDAVAAGVLLEQLGQVLRLGNRLDQDSGSGPVAQVDPVAAVLPGLAGVFALELARHFLGDGLEERLGQVVEREQDHRDAPAHQMLHHRARLGLVLALGAGAEVHGHEGVAGRRRLDAFHHLEEALRVAHARRLHRVLRHDGRAQGQEDQQVDPAAIEPGEVHLNVPPGRRTPTRWRTTCGTPSPVPPRRRRR